jgi:hypothetical protein
MQQISSDDLLCSMKFLGIKIPEERLGKLANCVNPTLQAFRSLEGTVMSKELEPTTFVFMLLKR